MESVLLAPSFQGLMKKVSRDRKTVIRPVQSHCVELCFSNSGARISQTGDLRKIRNLL
jgi:hypothetical protein